MLTVDPFTVAPGTTLDQMFEVRVFAQKQISLLKSTIKFDIVHPDGVVSEVQFDSNGGQLNAPLARQIYENWFLTEGGAV